MKLRNARVSAGDELLIVELAITSDSDQGVMDAVKDATIALLAEEGILALASGTEAFLAVMVESVDNKNCPMNHKASLLNKVAKGISAQGSLGGEDGHLLANFAEEGNNLDDAVIQVSARPVSARDGVSKSNSSLVGAAEKELVLVVGVQVEPADSASGRRHLE